jgi:trimeric autotransporter adhesin
LTNGIPIDLFATGEARWLEVQVAGEAPQPRVLLVSVPYALKAADAATLGGLPPSAFAMARPASEAASGVSPAITPNVASNVTTTGGTLGYVPEFSGVSSVVDSPIFVNTTGLVGIGTTTPTATLNVNGSTTLNGQLLLPATGTATATKGFSSQLVKVYTSAFNSSSASVVAPRFEWEAEVTGNNTAAPGATLNLLSSTTASGATETGFHFNANGTMNFVLGQAFPGTGTITGVTGGTGLIGGGAKGNVTLNLDTTKVPLLAANNTFTGNQSVTGSITSGASVFLPNTTSVTVGVVQLGAIPFLSNYGPMGSGNVFVGGAGNFTTTGRSNTAVGNVALHSDTTGNTNTAVGASALQRATTGSSNVAVGGSSLLGLTSGSNNIAVGVSALQSATTGMSNVAVGGAALFGATTGTSNVAVGGAALFGATTGSNNTAVGSSAMQNATTGATNTAVGGAALYSTTTGGNNTALGISALSTNTTGGSNSAFGVGAGKTSDGSNGTGSNDTAVGAYTTFGTGDLTNATAVGANVEVTQSNTMVLGCIAGTNGCPASVSVGIGTTTPSSLLTVNGSVTIIGAGSGIVFADGTIQTTAASQTTPPPPPDNLLNGSAGKPGGGSWGTYSDVRLKTLNGSFGSGLGQVMQLRPIRYRYKPDNGMGIRDADEHIGVVAQEVQRVIPEAVTENGKGYLLVNNDPIIWSMVNAIKEQQREIEQQRKLLRAQSAAMLSLVAEVRETRKTLRQVRAQTATGQLTMVAAK